MGITSESGLQALAASLRFGPQEALLILLLRFVGAAEEAMERAAIRGGPVGGATVPTVSIHDHHASGGRQRHARL